MVKIITDGACSKTNGGLGIIILKDDVVIKEYSNKYLNTTNNQMELGAIIIALSFIKEPTDKIILYSDSQYCIGCAIQGWKRDKNRKLWKEFDKQLERVSKLCSDIEFIHVKGHQSGNNISNEAKWNNYVDKLAVRASKMI